MWTRIIAVGLLVAGCTAPPPPQAAVTSPPAPVAQTVAAPANDTPVDGVYRGRASLVKVAGKHACAPPSGEVRLTIRDGVVTRHWNGAELRATVQPDGSFQSSGGRGLLAGRVSNGALEFDLVGEYCSLHYAMTRLRAAG